MPEQGWHRLYTKLAPSALAASAVLGGFFVCVPFANAAPLALVQNHQLYDMGSDILALQHFLNTNGFSVASSGPGSPGEETSFFGILTYKALVEFQTAEGLPTTGYLGPLTRAQIAEFTGSATSSTTSSPSIVASPSATTTSQPITSSTTPCGAPTGLTCIPGTSIVQPVTPANGYTPGFGGGSPAPSCSISVSPALIWSGQSTTLTWSSTGAFSTSIDNIGLVADSGSQSISPVTDTTYTANVSGGGGSSTCSTSVDIAPVISSVASTTITGESATITWTTDKDADTQLAYGSTDSYGATTSLDSTLTTLHSVVISGLTESTIYHFQVRSADASGNTTHSGDYSFATAPPLASLPLSNGARVSAIGDSIIGYNDGAGASFVTSGNDPNAAFDPFMAPNTYENGEIVQALASDPRFDFDTWYDASDPSGRNASGANNGVFSDHLIGSGSAPTPGILNRLPTVLSHHPDILILEGGTNTINSGDIGGSNAAYVENDIDAALTEAREAGVWVILTTLRPRGDWPAGDARYQTLSDVNTWIRAQADREGVYIWDPYNDLALNGYANPAYFLVDLVHPNQAGAYISSRSLLPILQSMVSPGSVFNQDPTVANLQTKGGMTGATGSKGTGVSGTVPTGYAVAMSGNSTAVASQEVISSTTEKTVLTITPVSGGTHAYNAAIVTMPNITTGLPSAGSWIQTELYVEIGTTTSISDARLNLSIASSSTVLAHSYTFDSFSSNFTTPYISNWSGWLVSTPMQVPTSTPFDRITSSLEIYFPYAATDTPVVKLSRLIVRQVADPRAAWGF